MMIGAIDDRYQGIGAMEMFAKGQPAETRAEHDHPHQHLFIAVHAPNFDEPAEIAMQGIRQNEEILAGPGPGSIFL
jgi:hypothetical protein